MGDVITTAEGSIARRPRTSRAVENDQRILDAAIWLVDQRGVDDLSLRDVAAAVDLTHGALYSRYDNVAELLVDLWQRRLADEIECMVRAAADLGQRIPEEGDPVWLRETSTARRAAVELCMVADRIDELAEVIPRDVARWMAQHRMLPGDGETDVPALGRFCSLLGYVVVAPVQGFVSRDVVAALVWVDRGFEPPFEGPAPEAWPPRPVEFSSGDTVRDAVLHSCSAVVARSGLGRATLKRIGRAAGCVPSAIYSWYDSRDDLMYDMVRKGVVFATVPQGDEVFGGIDAGPSLAAGWAEPTAYGRRRLHLEMYLAGKHDDRLAEVIDEILSEQFERVAAELAPKVPQAQRAAVTMLRNGNVVATGISILADLVPGLERIDWRPYSGAMLRGAFRMATAAAAPRSSEPQPVKARRSRVAAARQSAQQQ